MAPKPTRKTVELVRSTYQPTKADMEEEFVPKVSGDTVLDRMQNVARALTEPVKIRWIDRPRARK